MINRCFSKIIAFLLLFIISQTIGAQSYLWPTDASRLLTSTFAEYRPNRFHAGIDIKTGGKIGYPVFAIRSGHVAEVEVSPFGYGRLLCLKLDTGETVLYAHLQKFSPEIEAYVKQQQLLQGRFTVNLKMTPNQFPVQQGQVVAFTGQSGIGLPHLHFEVWDENGRPTNPLLKRFDLVDTIAPTIQSLAVLPLSATSRVNGDLRPVQLRPRALQANSYVIDQPIRAEGMIGFAVKLHDKMDDTWNGFGVYRLSLQLNDKVIFVAQYDFFDYAQNRQANLDRDYRLMIRGHGLYNRLFRDIGNELPFYGNEEPYYGVVAFAEDATTKNFWAGLWRFFGLEYTRPSGVIDLPAGKYELRITVQDFFGNTSVLSGVVQATTEGNNPYPAAAVVSKQVSKPQMNVEFYDDYIRVEVVTADVPLKPALVVHYENGSTEQLFVNPIAPQRYVAGIPFNPWREKPIFLQAIQETAAGKIKLMEKGIDGEMVVPNRSKIIASHDGKCHVVFDRSALFKALWVRITPLPSAEVFNGQLMSPVYDIQPMDVPLRKNVRIAIAIDMQQAQHVGLFQKKNHSDWQFVGDSLDSEGGWITAWASELGVYALIRDETPPTIFSLLPAAGQQLQNRRPLLRAKISDDLAGIGGEGNWELYLDGEKIIAEYDPEAHTLFYQPEAPLRAGEHQVRIRVRDRCGNTAERTNTFYII